jgi:membrane protein implicated in regulation of membrane protease activity
VADGKHCPACGQDIGVWPVFTAGLPNRIWCPHCSARLSYRGITGVVLVLMVMLAAVAAGAYFVVATVPGLHPTTQPVAVAGVMLVAWVVVELAVVKFLRGHRELVCRDRTHPGTDSQDAEPHS